MVIRHNLAAANAGRQYNIVGKRKAKNMEKLSSGYCINRAADDAAGLSISEKMRRQIRGLSQGVENTQDGVSLCQVADGALNEVHDMIHRLEELSVQSANGTNSEGDREMIQQEVHQILTEINRISDTTTFNEQNLFGGAAAEEAAIYAAQNHAGTPAKAAKVSSLMTYGIGASRAAGTVCGDFTVSGGTLGTDYTFSGGVLTIKSGAAVIIQNTNPASATTNRIEVASGVSANITLAGVNIDVSSRNNNAALKIADNSTGNITVTLAGGSSNKLKSGRECAGLQKNSNASSGTLRITGSGTLTVQGGYNAAGIGSSHFNHTSNIVISGGTVTAKGGQYGAGIGGSGGGGSASNITITGGTVTAAGGFNGAGIGGGSDYYNNDGNGENITITGGTVTATGGTNGAGIGGGTAGRGGNITITGGTITVTGGGNGADHIGSGKKGPSTSMDVKRLGGIITEGGVTTDYGGGTTGGGSGSTAGSKRWWIQCGSEPGVGMFVEIDAMNTNLLGLSGLNVTTVEGADDAMDSVGGALAYVSAMRSKIGAQQNRLEHTIANESNIVENITAAESCIRDADMAEEMVAFSIADIFAQAGAAMLAQANTAGQGALSLLQ